MFHQVYELFHHLFLNGVLSAAPTAICPNLSETLEIFDRDGMYGRPPATARDQGNRRVQGYVSPKNRKKAW